MKRTYTGTLFRPDLTTAKVRIYDYGESTKYEAKEDIEDYLITYTGVTAWDIIEGGEEAAEIEQSGMVDEFHEYLVLHFKDGNTATFMNSHVDMFIL